MLHGMSLKTKSLTNFQFLRTTFLKPSKIWKKNTLVIRRAAQDSRKFLQIVHGGSDLSDELLKTEHLGELMALPIYAS